MSDNICTLDTENQRPLKVFFSYSSKDEEIVENVYRFLDTYDQIEPIIDKTAIRGGDKILSRITYLLKKMDVLLIFLSPNSIESSWVEYELGLALHNHLSKDSPVKILPVLIDGDPKLPEALKDIKPIDLRSINHNSEIFQRLAETILENKLTKEKKFEGFYKASFETIKYPVELLRLQRMIKEGLNQEIEPITNKLSDIVEALRAQTNIMTPKSISIAEAQVLDSIWVITTHLYNDIYDDFIKKSVSGNMKRGINYYYFIVDTEILRKRREKYEEVYETCKDNYHFILLQKSFMPFDEVVIYDAADDFSRWGYVQIRYNEDNLFLRLSDRNLSNFMIQLQSYYNEYKNS